MGGGGSVMWRSALRVGVGLLVVLGLVVSGQPVVGQLGDVVAARTPAALQLPPVVAAPAPLALQLPPVSLPLGRPAIAPAGSWRVLIEGVDSAAPLGVRVCPRSG